jgi:quercetin dioxygenase-like cupin family protein
MTSLVRKEAWSDVPLEELNPLISRRLITAERMMMAHVLLKKGAIVPAHDHHNEQLTYILSGVLVTPSWMCMPAKCW